MAIQGTAAVKTRHIITQKTIHAGITNDKTKSKAGTTRMGIATESC
jgi:hypothetical protein